MIPYYHGILRRSPTPRLPRFPLEIAGLIGGLLSIRMMVFFTPAVLFVMSQFFYQRDGAKDLESMGYHRINIFFERNRIHAVMLC